MFRLVWNRGLGMTIGLIGRKCGMTRIFTEDGASIPVTVIFVLPNKITQIKTVETDGYQAIQVTTGKRKSTRVTKPLAGHFAKANVEAGDILQEFRLEDAGEQEFKLGSELTVTMFEPGQIVDVIGTSKGKGFAGVIKRHNFRSQDATHGNSLSHRAPGSIGQNQSPSHVFKGKKMAGHLGDERCSIQNQEIIKVDAERNLLLIRGAVPGAPSGYVTIMPAKKHSRKEKK
jgi:large subunit ribosomal protein L3